MDQRVVEFRIGVLVLATAVIAGILLLLFRDGPLPWSGTYTLRVPLPNARGVTEGTPVRKLGILVGRVSGVEFVENEEGVMVTAEIRDDITIYDDEICRLRVSLLGDAELEIVKRDGPAEQPQVQAQSANPQGNPVFALPAAEEAKAYQFRRGI